MGLIYRMVRLSGAKGEREVKALFDTGASRCFLRRDLALVVAEPSPVPMPLVFETATGLAMEWNSNS